LKRAYATIPPCLLAGRIFLAGTALTIPLALVGCGNGKPVPAESSETRVTQGEGLKFYPRFSPDGNLLAYSTKDGGGQKGGWAVYVVPSKGGDSKRVSPDSLSEYAIDWAPDGKSIFVFDDATSQLCRLSLDGSITERYQPLENGHVEDASPDGNEFLAFRFNGVSYDAGILKREGGTGFESISETPEWELFGSFGPKPGDITVCQLAAYSSPTSTIAIWSPTTKVFTPLSVPRGRHLTPTWSADGRYLAYSSDALGNRDLWVYDEETGRAVPVTKTPEDENAPHWSPDGSSVAFSRESRTSHLFVADMHAHTKHPLTQGPDWDGRPMCSRDGKWVAFLRRSSTEASNAAKIYVMSVADSVVRPLDLGGLEPQTDRRYLSWSPDDREVVLALSDPNGNIDVYRVLRESNGSIPMRVTIDPGIDAEPTWSSDGNAIAYLRMGEGESEIWVIPAHGGIPRRVSQSQEMCEGPVWAPDSNHLAYQVAHGLMRYELWVTSMTRPEDAHRVLPENDSNWAAAWSQDGKEILVARMNGKRYAIDAVTLDGKNVVPVGKEPDDKADRPFLVMSQGGERYFKALYPSGTYIYADGETHSDIFILRVRDLLSGKIAS
jgi:Tol biopolymer transport system component